MEKSMLTVWQQQDEDVKNIFKSMKIPDTKLTGIPFVEVAAEADFATIPKSGGVYFIWTDEPITHHIGGFKYNLPKPFDGGRVVYTGKAKQLRGRAEAHLLRKKDFVSGMSAISVDIYPHRNDSSHTKTAFAVLKKNGKPRHKTAMFATGAVFAPTDLLQMGNLTTEERAFIQNCDGTYDIYFQNGIDVTSVKHSQYRWRFYFIAGLTSAQHISYLEDYWRAAAGQPQLCTYKDGR